jgi:dipeptidase E
VKLVLCSEGFHTPNTVQACVDLVGKSKDQISVAIINEAFAVEEGDKRWVLDNLNSAATKFGGDIDIIDLLALPIEDVKLRIEVVDVIFVVGGHTDYLMSLFVKTGFDKLLPELLESKVYVGSSAGSMVPGKRLSEKAYKQMYGEENTYGTTQFLELVDFSIMPHLDSEHFPMRKENLMIAVKDHQGLIYGLRDDSAVIVDGDKIYTIGSEPVKLIGGEQSE